MIANMVTRVSFRCDNGVVIVSQFNIESVVTLRLFSLKINVYYAMVYHMQPPFVRRLSCGLCRGGRIAPRVLIVPRNGQVDGFHGVQSEFQATLHSPMISSAKCNASQIVDNG